MSRDNIFVIMQETADNCQSTIYPEVHYIYSDDNFVPAMDVVEQQWGDISVLVDFDESGQEIVSSQSLSSGWQVLDSRIEAQNLDKDQPSRLLSITGTKSRVPTDIPDLDGSVQSQVSRAMQLVENLELRNREIRQLLDNSLPKE